MLNARESAICHHSCSHIGATVNEEEKGDKTRLARARSRVTSHKESLSDETRYAADAVNVDACSITRDYLLFLYVPPFLRRSRCLRRIARLGWPR